MGFLLFIGRRVVISIPLLIAISIASFAIIVAVPGDYVDSWIGQTMAQTGQTRAELMPRADALRAELGLDQPLPVQYWIWIKNIVLSGDFGQSFAQSRPVSEVIGTRLPRSMAIAIVSLVLGQTLGVLLGIYAAVNQYRWGDTVATVVAFMGIVIPKFIIALIMLYLLAFVWHSPYLGSLYSPEFLVQESMSLAKLWDLFLHVWPILLISVWAGMAYTTRMMRGNLLDVMNAQYIETARAKGLSRRKVLFKHAVPNALHPVVMNMGGRFDYMIKGELEIAIVLGVPTLGPLILSSVAQRDMYVVSAIFLLVAVLLVVGNLLADIVLALIDPRVRRATVSGENRMSDISPTHDLNAEAVSEHSLSYWQLVRKRFRRNRYGMFGLIGCLIVITLGVFSGFFAPYESATKDRSAIYSPPQAVHFFAPEGGLARPYVLGFEEIMDPNTFEITFEPSVDKRVPIQFFVKAEPWSVLGITFETRLFGGANGEFVHLIGTDGVGRDVLSRMIHGSRITLMMGFMVMSAALVIGTVVGVSSGYFGGVFDLVAQRVIEFVKSFPDLPLYLALVAILPRRADPMTIFILFASILVLLQWANLARELRGKVISIRSVEYVRAAVAVGASDKRIMLRHIIPNVSSHMIVWATYTLPEVILLESFLSFLGVGVQAPMVSWGVMLNQVRDFQSLALAPWLMAPVGIIILSVLAFNALGDGLRDAMDPYSND